MITQSEFFNKWLWYLVWFPLTTSAYVAFPVELIFAFPEFSITISNFSTTPPYVRLWQNGFHYMYFHKGFSFSKGLVSTLLPRMLASISVHMCWNDNALDNEEKPWCSNMFPMDIASSLSCTDYLFIFCSTYIILSVYCMAAFICGIGLTFLSISFLTFHGLQWWKENLGTLAICPERQ